MSTEKMTFAGEERGWVIERYYSSELKYWDGHGTSVGDFVKDNLSAVRFARKEDADCVLCHLLDSNGRVAEHMWIGPEQKA